jgi:rhomboid protease GluP
MSASERMSILCPHCRQLISRDEPKCPYCGIGKPGSWWKGISIGGAHLNEDNLIRTIIVVNAVLFTVSILISAGSRGAGMSPFGFLSPSPDALFMLGATGTVPIGRFHRWWTLISASYLHGGILHILFNMAALNQIGPLVLHEFGFHRWIIIYTVGGAIGFLLSYLMGVSFTIGASASVCALIGAALYYGKSRSGFYGETIFRQLMGWVMGIFVFGLLVQGVNNWGHGGGVLGGILLGYVLGYHERSAETYYHKMGAMVCMVLTVVILLWALVSALTHGFGHLH